MKVVYITDVIMKRTVTVNIAGMAFIVDEDAYSLLKSYLNDISRRLNDGEKEETMQDIENRIAEIFRNRGAFGVKVVSVELVREMISIIGVPATFSGDAEDGKQMGTPPPPYHAVPTERRFMRDPRHRVLGGVCSGAAAFFGMDTVIVRVITFLLVFLAGLSVWIYIILWIVIPAARTPQELEMMDRMREERL